jgi:hypothetical protein
MAMGALLAIRMDLGADLRCLARFEGGGRVARLIALANALDGMSREAASHATGMDRQTLPDWVIRSNAERVDGLRDAPRPGRLARMTEGQQATGLSVFSCIAGHGGEGRDPPLARQKAPAIPDEVLDQLLSGASASTAVDGGGLLDQLKKALAERALNAEMDHHLGGEAGTGNSRNGYGRKSVVTDTGRIALEVPRDR